VLRTQYEVIVLDRANAEYILEMTDKEMSDKGEIGYRTSLILKEILERAGLDYLNYLYMEGTALLFNSGRWKHHFIEGGAQ
jgi:hypothetical protein